MGKYCSNCGNELNEVQDICLKCGVLLPKSSNNTKQIKKTHSGYIKTSSIIMIIIGAFMIVGAKENMDMADNIYIVFILPGIFSVLSGILALCSNKNKILLLISGICFIFGALINFFGIVDISIFMILSVIFGIFNIVYSIEKKD